MSCGYAKIGGSIPGQDIHKNQEMAGFESQAKAKCSAFKELWYIWETGTELGLLSPGLFLIPQGGAVGVTPQGDLGKTQ